MCLPCINYARCKTIEGFISAVNPFCHDCFYWPNGFAHDGFASMSGDNCNFALQYVHNPCDICKTTGRLHVDLTIRSICIECYLLAVKGPKFAQFPGTHPLGTDHETACNVKNFFRGNKFINNSCDVCVEYQQAQKQHWYTESNRILHEKHILRTNAFSDVTVIKSAPYDKYCEYIRSWNPADMPAQIEMLEYASIQWKVSD